MGNCLYCFESIQLSITWTNMIQINKSPVLCQDCHEKLEEIQGNRCLICSRRSEFDSCYDCLQWKAYIGGADPLSKNISIFVYNDFMKKVITKWKYRGDYILGYIFRDYIQRYFKQYYGEMGKEIIVIPIPLTLERLSIRGFNQSELLVHFLKGIKIENMYREINEKQAKKSKKARLMTENPFKLTKKLNKSVVLVDDIYTTGRTLRHAAQLLKKNGSENAFALTLCRA